MSFRQIRRQAQVKNVDEFIDRSGSTRTAEDDLVIIAAADSTVDNLARLLPERRDLGAGMGRLAVSISIEWQHLRSDQILDKIQRTSRSGIVGVDQWLGAKGRLHAPPITDDAVSNPVDQFHTHCHFRAVWEIALV